VTCVRQPDDLNRGNTGFEGIRQSCLPFEVGCYDGGVTSGVPWEDGTQVMRHSEECKTGYLDLGVLMLAADDRGERACGGGVRVFWQRGILGGGRDGLLQLHLILKFLFELGEAGQQGFCWLHRARWVASGREKLRYLVADIDHVQMQVAVGAIVKRVRTAALEVNEPADLLGITAADRTQLFAGNRVPDKDRLVQMLSTDFIGASDAIDTVSSG
jgi:hypothetical protein